MGQQQSKVKMIQYREFFHDDQLYPCIRKWMENEYLMFEYDVEELLVEYCMDDNNQPFCQGYIKTTRELDNIRNLFREHCFTEILMYYSENYNPSDCMIDMVLYKNKRC